MNESGHNKIELNPKLDKNGLWRLTGHFGTLETPWTLNDLQRQSLTNFKKAVETGAIKFIKKKACACGSRLSTQIANIDRFNLSIDSYVCEKCGLIYASPVLSPDSLRPFYKDFYHLMHFGTPPSPQKNLYKKGQGKKIYRLLRKWFDGDQIKVLEIGCGNGNVIKEFIREAIAEDYKAVGIGLEYSKDYIKCFDPEDLDVKIIEGDLHDIASSSGPFDVVIMSHVFEHLLEPHLELQKIKNFIEKHSLIYIEVPGIFSLRYRYTYSCDYLKYFTFSHIYNYNLSSLTNTLNCNGFGLLWGNEEVESVYLLGEQSIDTTENAKNVIQYLQDLERNLLYYSGMPALLTDQNIEIKKIKRDLQYVKSVVDKSLSFFPFRWYKNVKYFFKNNK